MSASASAPPLLLPAAHHNHHHHRHQCSQPHCHGPCHHRHDHHHRNHDEHFYSSCIKIWRSILTGPHCSSGSSPGPPPGSSGGAHGSGPWAPASWRVSEWLPGRFCLERISAPGAVTEAGKPATKRDGQTCAQQERVETQAPGNQAGRPQMYTEPRHSHFCLPCFGTLVSCCTCCSAAVNRVSA